MEKNKGSFTLPGESGYEALTLRLAEKWGADIIRDSDGTVLSKEILEAGYGIYSTICLIRNHNVWANEHPGMLQQTLLMTEPRVAVSQEMSISLMEDFYEEQFAVNETEDSLKYWQVYDRTVNCEVDRCQWSYDPLEKKVCLSGITPWHRYTVSFFAWRIWEEISMYNHVTNHWDREHLVQIDPRYEEVQEYLLDWLEKWCEAHPATTVVRFTSLFYNFVWIWGRDVQRRNLFTDWASYDFTVSPKAFDEFTQKYGYGLKAEDFVNQGKRHVTHMPGDRVKRKYMEFINDFVIEFGKKLVETVHRYGKKAYVFYDDSWIGVEPYGERFEEFGFDGIIKAVFSGFEARLCGGVKTKVHELRLHPYLFPTGVDGSPSFLEDGDPTGEARKYWMNLRRAILRVPIERIGFGGYLHLVEKKPDFEDYVKKLAEEFRSLKALHQGDSPYCLRPRIAVLHVWGKLRSWTCSGHMHETNRMDLSHVNESLSGLPFQVSFIDFGDIKKDVLDDYDVVINSGTAGSAWSGGDVWKDPEIVERLTEWVYRGGVFLGIREPSAVAGEDTCFRMSHVLGVDKNSTARVCHGNWTFEVEDHPKLLPDDAQIRLKTSVHLTEKNTIVYRAEGEYPLVTEHKFGKGKGVYLSSYEHSAAGARLLMNLILHACEECPVQDFVTDNYYVECAWYPEKKVLAIINNDACPQSTKIRVNGSLREYVLQAYEMVTEQIIV